MTLEEAMAMRLAAACSLDELADPLEHLLTGSYAVFRGRLRHIRVRVDQTCGLRIEVYPNEHPPPHFHVRGPGINASFTVEDCVHLSGDIDGRKRELIEWWHVRARDRLIAVWNRTRPTDCPVGAIVTSSGA